MITSEVEHSIWRFKNGSASYLLALRVRALRVDTANSASRVSPALAAGAVRRLLAELRDQPAVLARILSSFGMPSSFRPLPHSEQAKTLIRLVENSRILLFREIVPVRSLAARPPQKVPTHAEISAPRRAGKRADGKPDSPAGPQVLGFGEVDRPGRDGLFKSIKSKNPSRHGYAYEYGRNAADYRHAKDCARCGVAREVKVQGDVLDGKCGADAVLADGTLVQRKSYKRLSSLRAAVLKQTDSDLRRYGNRDDPRSNWRSGRESIALNGKIEFQIDIDRLLRYQPAPASSPTHTRDYITAWCEALEEELNSKFAKPLNGKRPHITVKAVGAGERFCPLMGKGKGAAA